MSYRRALLRKEKRTNSEKKMLCENAREVSKTHNMYISEQNAPEDFAAIWEKPFTRMMNRNKDNIFKVTEKLFVHMELLKDRRIKHERND